MPEEGDTASLNTALGGTVPVNLPATTPIWLETLGTGILNHAHFVLSGNLRDLFPIETDGGYDFVPIETAIRSLLSRSGFRTFLTFDPVDGAGLYASPEDLCETHLEVDGDVLRRSDASLETLADLVRIVSTSGDEPVGLFVRHASHLAPPGSAEVQQLFVGIDKRAYAPAPSAAALAHGANNPVIWFVDHPGDLPDWFVVGSHLVQQIRVGLPDLEERYRYARWLNAKTGPTSSAQHEEGALQQLALLTEGMTLREISVVMELAARSGHGLAKAEDAIRSYRTGRHRNPWNSPLLMERMKAGSALLSRRIKGQNHAIASCLQILTRAVLGLSGAQARARLNRPRGVLFFTGPPGVGKTELAKSITELLFGDEAMCQRFDMTEFNSERSVARLIGAPPGFPGHELGGELTNALRRRPFSVVLFDEVEKAHPRVLDMFLQILDDGRLTDARGEISYFSDAIVIFTSNVGTLSTDIATNLGMEILPSDSYDALRRKLIDGIRRHFVKDLRRPELLNRLGQNIVAFNFIQHGAAVEIFEAAVERVIATVRSELGIEVVLAPEAEAALSEACIHHMMEGGRGIASRVETHLVNPLSEALLDHLGAPKVRVERLEERQGEVRLHIRSC